jgi:ribosomal protein L37E
MDEPREKSYGNISDAHWTRARRDANREDIEYYRERSRAPGVAEGGGERNFYCMECDGVVPFDHAGETCPHCGAAITGRTRRYFNWVEIDQPGQSDLRALAPWLAGALLLLVLVVLLIARWLS